MFFSMEFFLVFVFLPGWESNAQKRHKKKAQKKGGNALTTSFGG
jgi:hypothetical protein